MQFRDTAALKSYRRRGISAGVLYVDMARRTVPALKGSFSSAMSECAGPPADASRRRPAPCRCCALAHGVLVDVDHPRGWELRLGQGRDQPRNRAPADEHPEDAGQASPGAAGQRQADVGLYGQRWIFEQE